MNNQNGDNDMERSESQESIPSRVTSGPPQGFSDEGLDGAVPISPMTAHALLKTTSVRYTKLAALQQKRYYFNFILYFNFYLIFLHFFLFK